MRGAKWFDQESANRITSSVFRDPPVGVPADGSPASAGGWVCDRLERGPASAVVVHHFRKVVAANCGIDRRASMPPIRFASCPNPGSREIRLTTGAKGVDSR